VNMGIELPTFENSYGLLLTACGRLRDEEIRTKGKRREERTKVARYYTASGTAFVRASLGYKQIPHLHVDCVLRKYFPKDRIPKVTHKKAEVLKIIERVLGTTIELSIVGCFKVPMTELPEGGIIHSLSVEQKTVDVSIRLTGGSYTLTGAPVKEIHWRELQEGKRLVHVRIKGEKTSKVSEAYLREMWDWINDQFSLFVLGKIKNART